MVTLGKVHVGDVNTDFQLLVEDTDITNTNNPVDLATTTVREIIFTDPSGNESTKSATILNPPGTDGVIHHVNSDAAFIDEAGLWHCRGKLTFSGGGVFQSNDLEFEVLGPVE